MHASGFPSRNATAARWNATCGRTASAPWDREDIRLTDGKLPAYAPMLAAYHRAFAGELRTMIGWLPLEPGASVLDLACGDGTYSVWLAERVGAGGTVLAVDVLPAYLNEASRRAGRAGMSGRIEFAAADIDRLP